MTQTFGTLGLFDRFPATIRHKRRSAQTGPETGFVARRQLQSSVSRNSSKREVRQYTSTFDILGATELADLVDAYDDAIGVSLPILWRPSDEAGTIPVRFVSQELTIRHLGADHYQATADLEEVI